MYNTDFVAGRVAMSDLVMPLLREVIWEHHYFVPCVELIESNFVQNQCQKTQ